MYFIIVSGKMPNCWSLFDWTPDLEAAQRIVAVAKHSRKHVKLLQEVEEVEKVNNVQ